MQNFKLCLSVIVSLCLCFGLSACQAKTGDYYRLHPRQLEKALRKCESRSDESCQQLEKIAIEINELAYQLKSSPQGFGQKIIAMQIEKAKLLQSKSPDNKQAIAKLDSQLAQYLAIVGWLESPES